MLRPPRHAPDSECCAELILDLFRGGELSAQRRLGAASIARRRGAGLQPMRSALNHLESLGLLQRRPRSGTYLRTLTLQEYVEAAQLRAVMEGLAARCAAISAPEKARKQIVSLAAQLDRVGSAANAPSPSQRKLEARFHHLVARASGNQMLIRAIEGHEMIVQYLAIESLLNVPYRFEARQGSHRDIARAIQQRRGDPESAWIRSSDPRAGEISLPKIPPGKQLQPVYP